ncbi:U1 snRNP-associated protein Usp104 [Lentithecium fluviatile CBS 122367]|uniref:U1 snRNP-associated protein Usp104 n=1 Tax=Lentithecium fluviatile CBS 122367 TaxID=1168545 RepID=A0A6G1JL79_9PLEO|nr:U1 snRNP-associated protein Usp104 [Lentithecium fluviatile CBS 122367]
MNGYPPPPGPGMMVPPPTPWRALKTADGKEYYHNTLTNTTSWEKPEELMTNEERAIIGTPWRELKHNDRPYWAHKTTQETTWTIPPEVAQNLERLKSLPPQRPPPGAWPTGPAMPVAPAMQVAPSLDHGRNDRERERDSYVPDRRDRDRDRDRDREPGFGADRPSMAFAPSNELQFSSPQEAEAAFMKVLKQLKVQADWDWPRAVRAGIKDPNWRAIPDPEKREEAFRKYCDDLRAQEKNKEQDRQAKLRVDFMAMLRSHPEIKHYTRWKTTLPILEDETVFRSARDDTERRQLFEEYIISLRRANGEKEVEDKKTALDDLLSLLQGLDLEPFTRWQAAEEKLEETKQFNSEKFQSLHRLDVLNTFEKHIRLLQREHNDRVQAERREKHRIERKNRDGFKQLLTELQETGRLKSGTKWKDIHDVIQDDPRYSAMLGQSGSSPLDLFWDALEIEEQKFRTLRRYALDVLEHQRFEVTTATPIEDFLSVMRADPRTTNIDDQSMRSIFEYVINKVRKREEEERRDEEHNERYAMDNLRSVIKRLDPIVTLSDTWEAVRPRIEKTDEYRALKSDTLRQSVFDKYFRRLKEKESDRRDRSRRDLRDRDRERDRDRDRRDRDREYRNGHSDSHRRHRTRTRSPEHDPYAAERRQAQQDREARYRNNDSTGLSPPYRRDRERDGDRYERSRQGSGDHYGRERREREAERERSYISRGDPLSRADPRDRDSVSELDYGDGGRPTSVRRRRESDESASRRDNKRARYSPRHDRKSKTPVPEPTKEERALRSGSEEGEIEED